jgi:hypothetical protein
MFIQKGKCTLVRTLRLGVGTKKASVRDAQISALLGFSQLSVSPGAIVRLLRRYGVYPDSYAAVHWGGFWNNRLFVTTPTFFPPMDDHPLGGLSDNRLFTNSTCCCVKRPRKPRTVCILQTVLARCLAGFVSSFLEAFFKRA